MSTHKISIVTTLYNSSLHLREFYDRVCKSVKELTSEYEIILVNDGSPDDSLGVAIDLFERDKNVRVIDFSRNFGQHRAIMTGLSYANGDLVFLIDCDLEIQPEVLKEFYDKFKDSQADVIYGVQRVRQGDLFKRLVGGIYYKIFNWLCVIQLPENLVMVRLMTRRYVSAFITHHEREVTLGGLWVITGFNQVPIVIDKTYKGKSDYTFTRKIVLLVNAITSFSNRPLIFIFYIGCIVSFISFLAAIYLTIKKIFFRSFLVGWPSVMVSIWLVGGMMIFCLGITAIYLSKIFIETKQRPYTIIRKIYDHLNTEKENR